MLFRLLLLLAGLEGLLSWTWSSPTWEPEILVLGHAAIVLGVVLASWRRRSSQPSLGLELGVPASADRALAVRLRRAA
jgi:hypothetical protein